MELINERLLINRRWLLIAVFVCLNLLDAFLTNLVLNLGGIEAFWWGSAYNSHYIVKLLIPLFIGTLMLIIKRPRILLALDLAFLVVVLANFRTWLLMEYGF